MMQGVKRTCVIVRTGCEKAAERHAQWVRNGLVAQDTIKGGAADAELAGGAQLVAAVQVEHILHVMADDRIEAEVVGPAGGLRLRLNLLAGGQEPDRRPE